MLPVTYLTIVFLASSFFIWAMGLIFINLSNKKKFMVANADEYGKAHLQSPMARLKPLLYELTAWLKRFPLISRVYEGQNVKYHTTLLRAGNPGLFTGEEIFSIKLFSPIFTFIVVSLALNNEQPLIAFIVSIIAFFLPDLWIRDLRVRRMAQIKRDFPDAIDNFALMMDAGLTINQAIEQYVSAKKRSALQDEFYIAQSEMRLGKTASEALRSMSGRLGVEEIKNFSTTVSQSMETGISMQEFILYQSEAIREERFQNAEEKGQTAQFKLLVPLMLFVMPCVFMILFAPMAIKYITGDF